MVHDLFATIENARIALRHRRPVLVGVDGPSGAGKSTFARRIEENAANVFVVHRDDFYSASPEKYLYELSPAEGYESYFDWDRLRRQVLLPISSGHAATFQRYD